MLWALMFGCGASPERSADEDVPELIGVWYEVGPGDSVSRIAERHAVPVEDIVELNGLANPDRLEVGQPLFLYGIEELLARKAKVKSAKADGASKAASRPGAPKPAKAQKPPRSVGKTPSGKKPAGRTPARKPGRKPAPSKYVWPVDGGRLTSGYGRRGRRMHKGIDIAAKPGTPIKAAAAGEVIYSDNKQRGYGNLVILQHADDSVTVYAHNRRNLVDEGETVRQGSVIAELGNTGRSTGPHLHFELRLKGKAVDPLIHLPAR